MRLVWAFQYVCPFKNNNIDCLQRMNNESYRPSLLQRTLAWIHQYAYQPYKENISRAKNIFLGKEKTTGSPERKMLLFSNIIQNPAESRKMALNHIRNLHQIKDEKQRKANLTEKLKKVSHFWGKRQNTEEKPPELLCPICMDFLVGGVSTKCGHTFCWQCLDEALLLNPRCPVCRQEIRGTDFTASMELAAIIRRYLKRLTNEQHKQHELLFNARIEEFEQWLLMRVVDPHSLKSSDLIDVRDTEHIWCSGLVKQIWEIEGRKMVLIHYIGWSNYYDEVIPIDSQRLASYRLYSSRKDIPHYQLEGGQGQLEGFVIEEPQIEQSQSSADEENEQIFEFEDEVHIEIVQENDDEDQQLDASSAKPLRLFNPQV